VEENCYARWRDEEQRERDNRGEIGKVGNRGSWDFPGSSPIRLTAKGIRGTGERSEKAQNRRTARYSRREKK